MCECDGSGKIVDRIDHSNEPWRDIGHGLQIGGGFSITSRLCECRKDLPRREGEASWWTTETVQSEDVELPSGLKTITIGVTCEVPISEDNYPLIRDEPNAYYPAMVELAGTTFIADDIRSLISALERAVGKCDELDGPIMVARGMGRASV